MPPSQLLLLSLPLLLPRASDPSYLRMLLLPLDARAASSTICSHHHRRASKREMRPAPCYF